MFKVKRQVRQRKLRPGDIRTNQKTMIFQIKDKF